MLKLCFSARYRWGSSEDMWVKMINKEQNYRHGTSFLQKHPRLEPRMRSILLDWLIEVRLYITNASLLLFKCRTECRPQFSPVIAPFQIKSCDYFFFFL